MYNTSKSKEFNAYVSRVNYILRKNRKILSNLTSAGKISMKSEELLNAGFNFNYFTNIHQVPGGNKYYFCYDFGYTRIGRDKLTLIRQKT
ncbi:MAG: hypothetical protein ABIJ16_04955 [Bacteroidota bacterium]